MMSTRDHVASGALAKLSINCKSGASKLVCVVECSPHEVKLEQLTIDFCAWSLGLHHLQFVGSE